MTIVMERLGHDGKLRGARYQALNALRPSLAPLVARDAGARVGPAAQRGDPHALDARIVHIALFGMAAAGVWLARRALRKRFAKQAGTTPETVSKD